MGVNAKQLRRMNWSIYALMHGSIPTVFLTLLGMSTVGLCYLIPYCDILIRFSLPAPLSLLMVFLLASAYIFGSCNLYVSMAEYVEQLGRKWRPYYEANRLYLRAQRYRQRRQTKTHLLRDTLTTTPVNLPNDLVKIIAGYDLGCCVIDCEPVAKVKG